MKRKALIAYLCSNGCSLAREGGRHSLYVNDNTGRVSAVPRHPEVKDNLVKEICKELGVPYPGKN